MTTGIPDLLTVRDLPSEASQVSIPYPDDKIFVDYVVVNNNRLDHLVKTKILDFEPKEAKDVPEWDLSIFDTFEDIDPRPECTMKPVTLYRCPFRKGKHKIVLCEVYDKERVPLVNTRAPFVAFMRKPEMVKEEAWIGFEQEYWVTDRDGIPLGWEMNKNFIHHERYLKLDKGRFSGLERQLADYHARACLYAGINLFGLTREESVGQWEYMLGPGDAVSICDDLVVSRYLMKRAAEVFGVHVSFLGKPAPFTVWASGVHLNFSTKNTRAEGGIKYINEAIQKLARTPQPNILKYYDRNEGKDNQLRLIGDHFIPSFTEFTYGVADKFASVRIPVRVAVAGRGYFEERRLIADCDPYTASLAFMKAVYTDELL